MLNLDTNIILNALAGTLRAGEVAALESESWSISAIVLWEVERPYRSGVIRFGLDDHRVAQLLLGTRVCAISPQVCLAMRQLDFQSEPADELIAATSLAHNAPLLTRDSQMLASKVVPLAVR